MQVLNRRLLAASAFVLTTFSAELTDTTSSSLSATTLANIGDYIATGLALEKVETNTASSYQYTSSNATSNASLLSLATGVTGSLTTPYANNSLESADTATDESPNASLSTLTASAIFPKPDTSSDGALTAPLLLLATGATLSNFTTSSNTASNASLLSVATGGGLSLNTSHANNTLRGGNTVTVSSTSWVTSCRPSSTDSRGQVWSDCDTNQTLVTKTFTNKTWASATNAEDCWTDWVSYWSMHEPSPATISVGTIYLPVTTETDTYLYTLGSTITDKTITSTILSTAPTEADNGGFTTTMSQVVVTYITVLTSFVSATSTSTSLDIWTRTPQGYNYTTVSASYDADWPPPSCTLPVVYSDCQSQWEDYAAHNAALAPQPLATKCEFNVLNMSQSAPACYTNGQASWDSWRSYVAEATSPICSQASITGALCTSLKDAYVLGYNDNLAPKFFVGAGATFSSGSFSLMNPAFTGWTWPASQPFAPGCSLDCGRCAVTGGSIELLYFPPGMTPHPATAPVVATTLGTVLTSPTYYISFASIYASDACSGVGKTLTSLILPIPTDQPLSTLFGTTMPCDAHRKNNPWLNQIAIGTAAMNVSDLMHESVPYSIYTSQPYCASQMMSSGCEASACPTTLPYRPLVVLSSQLLNTLDPAWASCSLDLRGLYDPPLALQPATAVVVPTMASPSPTTSATPADPPAGATPDPTALPVQNEPTTGKASDNPPEPTSPSVEAPKPTPNDTPPAMGQPSDDSPTPTSPSAEVSRTTPDDPPPETSQRTSDDPAGAIISLIGDLTSQNAGTSEETPVPGGTVVQPPPAQNSAKPPAEASGSPDDSQDNPVSPGLLQVAAPNGASEQVANNNPTVVSVGSQLITATPGQPLVVSGTTLLSNAPVVIDGHTLSSGSAGLVVDGTSVVALPSSEGEAPAAEFTVGSQTFTASAADAVSPSAVVVAGTTLSRGGPAATISGAIVSAGSVGLVIDGKQTVQLPVGGSVPTAANSHAIFTVGSSTITAILATGSGNAIVVDGTTSSRGDSAVTVDGTQVSAGTDGLVVDGSQTIPASDFEAVPTATAASQAILTVGGSKVTATAVSGTGTAIVIDGTTMSSGGPAITIHGTELSVGPSGNVIDGTRTIALETAPTPTDALPTVLTLGDNTITAILPSGSSNVIIVDGTTLSPGGSAITVDGTQLSAGTAGLVVGGTSTVSHKITTVGPQATEEAGTGAPDAPTATDSSSTSDSAQSGSQHAFRSQGKWFITMLGLYISLGVA